MKFHDKTNLRFRSVTRQAFVFCGILVLPRNSRIPKRCSRNCLLFLFSKRFRLTSSLTLLVTQLLTTFVTMNIHRIADNVRAFYIRISSAFRAAHLGKFFPLIWKSRFRGKNHRTDNLGYLK